MDHEPLFLWRTAIADPTKGPQVAGLALAELGAVVGAIQADDMSPAVAYSDEEFQRRGSALASATERLAQMSALAGYWATVDTARLWPRFLASLLDARDRGNGLTPWLDLIAYPALLVMYAFGLGASIGRRYDSLAIVLTAPTPDERKAWQPAVLQLNPASIDPAFAVHLGNAKSARWPLSDHLQALCRPWFADIVPSDTLFEREFDRFETLASLVFYDLRRGDDERSWSPIGRFARHGRYDFDITRELIEDARKVAETSNLLTSLVAPGKERLTTTLAGFEEHVTKALGQVW